MLIYFWPTYHYKQKGISFSISPEYYLGECQKSILSHDISYYLDRGVRISVGYRDSCVGLRPLLNGQEGT
jgi:hypothetical protein